VVALAACAEPRAEPRAEPQSNTAATAALGAAARRAAAAAAEARLDSAAHHVVAFLRGQVAFESIRLADTVVLRLAPEGGGYEARVPRAALRSPSAWAVPAGRGRYILVPPAGRAQLTSAVGRHLNCQEYALAPRAPAWAPAPHVGVRLTPNGTANSCLRTWNATFVFDTSAAGEPLRLIGVLYDQWEW
jgi:hypothetical protein